MGVIIPGDFKAVHIKRYFALKELSHGCVCL